MKRLIRLSVSSILICCLMLVVFAPTALAADMRLAGTGGINFREGPSTDSRIIKSLDAGSTVEVLEHDPAGWSKVSVGGTVGYIKSEFLTIPSGTHTFKIIGTGEVNFRSGPSTDSAVISAVSAGTSVEVLEHDPAGWSKVKIKDTVGYIRSDFLMFDPQPAKTTSVTAQTTVTPVQTPGRTTPVGIIFNTINEVNFRSGPSTEHDIIAVLEANTSVIFYERDANGWSKVSYDGEIGYIMSELLSIINVELLTNEEVALIASRTSKQPKKLYDLNSGKIFQIYWGSPGKSHTDWSPWDQTDTDTMKSIIDPNGKVEDWNLASSWSGFKARPGILEIDDGQTTRYIAVGFHLQPHAYNFRNGYNGLPTDSNTPPADRDPKLSSWPLGGHMCMYYGIDSSGGTSTCNAKAVEAYNMFN